MKNIILSTDQEEDACEENWVAHLLRQKCTAVPPESTSNTRQVKQDHPCNRRTLAKKAAIRTVVMGGTSWEQAFLVAIEGHQRDINAIFS